jgi:hypothetical protein
VDSTIITALIALIGPIAGVIIGNRLAHTRSSRQRLWDLQRPAYGQILSGLGDVERICDDADEYISERGFHDYFDNPAHERHNDEIAKLMASVRRRFSDDYLILSDDFISIFNELTNEMATDPNSSPEEDHDNFAKAIRKYRPRLLTVARAEMTIQGRSSFTRFWKAK